MSIATPLVLALLVVFLFAAAAPAASNYARPFEPATKPAFIALPPGAIEPQGWLRDWCLTARDGYIGHMEEFHIAFKQAWAADYKMEGDKLFWQKGGWPYEGGGYWFEGLSRLAFALHDEELIKLARAKFEPAIANMNDKSISFIWWQDRNNPEQLKAVEGWHYRENEWPMWANGLFGRSLATYAMASQDARVTKALALGYEGSPDWVRLGWGLSNVWPAYEAWTWTGSPKVAAGLTALFDGPGDDKRNWPFNKYRRMPPPAPGHMNPNDHVVHFLESTSPWALGYLWTGRREFLDAPIAWNRAVEADCMQPHGVIVSDEHYGPTGAFRSSETCDVAGTLFSKLLFLSISGEGSFGDQIERAAFNAGPAMTSRDYKMHVYFQSPNRMANRALPPAGQCTFGKTHHPLCCTAALSRVVPYFVTNLWMATQDNGLAFVAYAPCKVSALAADRVPVELTCKTDYPFNESIEIAIKPQKPAKFPLLLRIPAWCKSPAISVNGTQVQAAPDAKGFARIEQTWKEGDVVRLTLPMSVQLATGRDKNAKAAPFATVSYGPLLFALPIAEKDLNTPDPASKWTYALAPADIKVERTNMPAKWDWPFDPPLKLQASGTPFDWKPTPQQALPAAPVADAAAEKITLIPYGCTKFRVSMFPVSEALWNNAGGK